MGREFRHTFISTRETKSVQYCTVPRAEGLKITDAKLNMPRRLNLGGMGGAVFYARRRVSVPDERPKDFNKQSIPCPHGCATASTIRQ